MFARKLKLTLRMADGETPVPKAWLDQFFMRNFTGYSAFDDTLPTADGLLEAGTDVDPAQLRSQFETWLRGRKLLPPTAELHLE